MKERSSCSEVFCGKSVLRNFAKFLRTLFFQIIPLVVASERVNADETAPLCSVAVGKETLAVKHNEFIFLINTTK